MTVLGDNWLASSEDVEPGFRKPICHSTSIAETDRGLLLAFFGGAAGGRQHIWTMRRTSLGWGAADLVAETHIPGERCWNPVLHQVPGGALLLFYKQGYNCAFWRGWLMRSDNAGVTWSVPEELPESIFGPIQNKPLALADGTLLCPSSTEHDGWHAHVERFDIPNDAWERSERLDQPETFGAIQPTLLAWPSGRIQALCRSKAGCIVQAHSTDQGRTWSMLERTPLPNPNSAIDAVMLPDGRAALVYNPTINKRGGIHGDRSPLVIAVSDDGVSWRDVATLESARDEFSYPAAIVTRDGQLHITYTAGRGWRGMRHAVVAPEILGS